MKAKSSDNEAWNGYREGVEIVLLIPTFLFIVLHQVRFSVNFFTLKGQCRDFINVRSKKKQNNDDGGNVLVVKIINLAFDQTYQSPKQSGQN